MSSEYCLAQNENISGSSYALQLHHQSVDELVQFYDEKMTNKSNTEGSYDSLPGKGSIHITRQILNTRESHVMSRWLFDTGPDIDATNDQKNFIPGTVVELSPKQFSIQTGNGIIFGSCMGEVLLPLKGPSGEKTLLTLKYVVCLNELPLNIISGERFYKHGGRLQGNQLINKSGQILTHMDIQRRGFFLWLHNQPETLKTVKDKSKQLSTNTITPLEGSRKMSEDVMKKLTLWHRRLCHPSADRLKWTIKNTAGIDLDVSDVTNLPCEACDMGKSVKFTTKERKSRMKNVGEGWHCDIGTINPVTIEGYAYFCSTTEDVSRVKRLTIDGGRDWGMSSFEKFASDNGIEVIVSAPDSQYQNGVSERGIRFIQDAARCCSIQMKVPSVFWNYMLDMTCYTLNCTSQSSVNNKKTPWEVYWSVMNPEKQIPHVDHLLIPSSLCIAHVDINHRIIGEKLDSRGTRAIFLGYRGTKNKVVWLLDGGRFLITPHVVVHETVQHGHGWPSDPREIVRSLPKHVQDRLKSRPTDYARNEDYNVEHDQNTDRLQPRGRGRPIRTIARPYQDQIALNSESSMYVDNELPKLSAEEVSVSSAEQESEKVRKILHTSAHHQIFDSNEDGDQLFRLLTTPSRVRKHLVTATTDEPTYRQAMSGHEKDLWEKAMFEEINGCLVRDTFKFVRNNNNPNRKHLVTAKWVLKKKYKSGMTIEKYKARIVARGFTQTKGIDYNESSSTTARSASWRTLMALAAINEWYILQADFISAYFAGELKEQVFMEQFPQLKEFFKLHPEDAQRLGYSEEGIIELKKPLYGLKQSGACWQRRVREIMKKNGYYPLISDNSIYYSKITKIIIASYVDDFLLFGPNREALKALTEDLNKAVSLHDLGDASWFLGVRVRRSSPTGSVRLDQEQYLRRSINELKITQSREIKTPPHPVAKLT